MYADHSYYLSGYLHEESGLIPEPEFDFYAEQASDRMDYMTGGKIKDALAELDEVKRCCCCVAEIIYRQSKATDNMSVAPIASWNNDGESGSYDMAHSDATQEGVNRKTSQAMRTYLWSTGLLYRGC